MIRELHIENVVVIERATALFEGGVTAITGASGVGKSVLLSALSLACGARSEADVIRSGCNEARVDLRFDVVTTDGTIEERVLTRVVPRDGRSRAYIDGRPSTAHALAELAASAIEIHGQHEQHRLGSVRVRSDLLDLFGGLSREEADRCAGEIAALRAEIAALGGDAAERQRELDFLEYQLNEIDQLAPGEHELDDLLNEERMLSDVDRIRSIAAQLLDAFDGDERLRVVAKELQPIESFASIAERLDGVFAELDDLAGEVRGQLSNLDDDPARLSNIRERISALKGLCRRYGDSMSEVLAFREGLVEQCDRLRHHDERAGELDAAMTSAVNDYERVAGVLRGERLDCAPRLGAVVTEHLVSLGMPHARFEVDVAGTDGGEVEFLFAPSGSEEPRPLGRIASGGETARCMLALDLAIGHHSDLRCSVFDEIDAGVDASAGDAIAHALSVAASGRQIIVVTHLATVAAAATSHLVIDKHHVGDTPHSTIGRVDGVDREREIARMLTGSDDSESVTVARRLLDR